VDAFDADVLIYAAAPTHPIGAVVRALLDAAPPGTSAGVGSVMLLPEMLSKPVRDGDGSTVEALAAVLGRLDLLPVDAAVARLAVVLAAQYRLRAADSVHLATAVVAGADRFITNNRKDFATTITEIDVVYAGGL
jgi:predicted nucleic acid-binding protein